MQQGHALKFVITGKTFDPNVGIKTYPRQTYGLSLDSPDYFKNKSSLTGENSYIYKHQNHPQFIYPSQQKYFNVHKCTEEGNYQTLNLELENNSVAFHRKKGRLSQFMDKNGWMSPVVPIMGFQRGQEARTLCNSDRERRIKSQIHKKVYQNPVGKRLKVNPEYYNSIEGIMSEKQRLRKKRNELKPQVKLIKVISKYSQKKDIYNDFERQNISAQMAKSNMDFYSTTSTFFNKQEKSKERMASPDKKFRSTSLSFKQTLNEHRNSILKRGYGKTIDAIDCQNQELDTWYKKNSNNNKWCYNPRREDSEQREQNMLYG